MHKYTSTNTHATQKARFNLLSKHHPTHSSIAGTPLRPTQKDAGEEGEKHTLPRMEEERGGKATRRSQKKKRVGGGDVTTGVGTRTVGVRALLRADEEF